MLTTTSLIIKMRFNHVQLSTDEIIIICLNWRCWCRNKQKFRPFSKFDKNHAIKEWIKMYAFCFKNFNQNLSLLMNIYSKCKFCLMFFFFGDADKHLTRHVHDPLETTNPKWIILCHNYWINTSFELNSFNKLQCFSERYKWSTKQRKINSNWSENEDNFESHFS